MNFIEGKIEGREGKLQIVSGQDIIDLPENKMNSLKEQGYIGKNVIMGIRPENIYDDNEFMIKHKNSVIEAQVEVTELMGAETYLYLRKGKNSLTVRINGSSNAKAGDKIKIAFDESKIHIFDKETELAIL